MSTLVSDRSTSRVKYNLIRNFSFSISLIFHLILFGLLLLVKISNDYPEEQPVEVSFGNSGIPGSSGALGDQLDNIAQLAKQNDEKESKDKSEELKNTEVPKVNSSDEDVIKQADKKKDKSIKKNKFQPGFQFKYQFRGQRESNKRNRKFRLWNRLGRAGSKKNLQLHCSGIP